MAVNLGCSRLLEAETSDRSRSARNRLTRLLRAPICSDRLAGVAGESNGVLRVTVDTTAIYGDRIERIRKAVEGLDCDIRATTARGAYLQAPRQRNL